MKKSISTLQSCTYRMRRILDPNVCRHRFNKQQLVEI